MTEASASQAVIFRYRIHKKKGPDSACSPFNIIISYKRNLEKKAYAVR